MSRDDSSSAIVPFEGTTFMSIAETFLAEFEREAQTTRKFLEQLPSDQLAWRPHEKSMTAGQLALHIAGIPGNVLRIALHDEMPAPDFGRGNPQPANMEEIFAKLEESTSTVREILPTISDERMQGIWKMSAGDKELMTMPRYWVLRSVLFNHWYQHRGQLGVYLRLLGAKVPSSYGPSGDELPDFMKK
jgi:uncharacterized damage-inducible protein DinB